jgi:F0F1-type ATP synthase membrane subunit b/b'
MPAAVDRVSISFQSRQAIKDAKKEETAIEESEREKAIKEAASRTNSGKSDGAAAKVQFVYDLNGELSIRYLDTADRLVYQSPSELMLQMKEAASKSDSSVDTEA